MAPTVAQTARIFEDPDPPKSPKKSSHKRIPSVGDVLRGRKKENVSPEKSEARSAQHRQKSCASPSPLGERHINSPPQSKKVALKDESDTRPPMHKKSGSTTSLKEYLLGRDRSYDHEAVEPVESGQDAPKKDKPSLHLGNLLKKRSKKDLKASERSLANTSPVKPPPGSGPAVVQTPTRPLEGSNEFSHSPQKHRRTIQEEIQLYTPKDYSEYRPSEQRNFGGYVARGVDIQPPQRPFLHHRGSRSSIFTENLDEEPTTPDLTYPKTREESPVRPSASRQESANSNLSDSKSSSSEKADNKPKRSSRVLDVIAAFNLKGKPDSSSSGDNDGIRQDALSPQELDSALENVLGRYDIPQNLRDHMRNLKPEVKAGLVKGERIGSGSSTGLPCPANGRDAEEDRSRSKESDPKDEKRSRSRSRARSRVFSMSKKNKDGGSPTKQETSSRSRSKSRPKSIDLGGRPLSAASSASMASMSSLATPDSTNTPGDFIHYLQEVQKPELVEVGKLHKLRILLRNESVAWTDAFVRRGGMFEITQLLYRTMKIEWREEHEDNLLHETLLCLKGLSTTKLALQRLEEMQDELFPALLKMLFDPERKGPAEFTTRAVVISLLLAHLSATLSGDSRQHADRARTVLDLMRDPAPDDEKRPLDFVSQMHLSRPYRVWCKEVVNVTKEVFWIFLHHLNVVPIERSGQEGNNFARDHFPVARKPHPAAPYVGGVEWEATQYLATHLDLLNGLIVSLPSRQERNELREDLRQSGWEKVMGGTLRTCKEKFYTGVHDGLRVWVSAAAADGWLVEDVRAGPPRESASPAKSPVKKKTIDEAPKLDLNVGPALPSRSNDAWL